MNMIKPQRHGGTEKVLISASLRLCGKFIIIALILFQSSLLMGKEREASSLKEMDCFSCHSYRTMAGFDKGISKSLYVDKAAFLSTSHGKAKCMECHEGFDELPHSKEDRKVDCLRECHITDKGVEKIYSHMEVSELIKRSVHSRYDKDGKLKKNPEMLPDCKGCHQFSHVEGGGTVKGQGLHKAMSKGEVLNMCGGCHRNPDVISKFGLSDALATYRETFHGKQLGFGKADMPDCIDCHSDAEKGAHLILSNKPTAPTTHLEDKWKGCSKKDCHPSGGQGLAGFHMHVSYEKERHPVEYYVRLFFRVLVAATLYSLLSLIFLELLRRLFPKFKLFKKKGN